MNNHKQSGFTLVEVLLVIGIIAILASIVIIAINPARQLAQARNTQRWSNVNTILNAIHQYAVDNKGNLPASIVTTSATEIWSGTGSSSSLTDLAVLTASQTYLTALPVDPSCPTGCAATGIGYTVVKSVNGRITVAVPTSTQELGQVISVTR